MHVFHSVSCEYVPSAPTSPCRGIESLTSPPAPPGVPALGQDTPPSSHRPGPLQLVVLGLVALTQLSAEPLLRPFPGPLPGPTE